MFVFAWRIGVNQHGKMLVKIADPAMEVAIVAPRGKASGDHDRRICDAPPVGLEAKPGRHCDAGASMGHAADGLDSSLTNDRHI